MYAIGIDTDMRKVVYTKKVGDTLQDIMADLTEANYCRVDIMTRTEKTPNGTSTVVEVLHLVITFKGKAANDKHIEFYNNDIRPLPGGQKALADKWQEIVSSAIKRGHK